MIPSSQTNSSQQVPAASGGTTHGLDQTYARAPRMGGLSRRVLAVVTAVAGVLACALGSVALLSGHTAPASAVPSTPQLVAMDDSPAVQLVSDHQSAVVTWYRPNVSLSKLVLFANHNPASVAAWSHRHYREASEDLVRQFLARARSYLAAGQQTQDTLAMTSYGSAWGVSANGYLITNHHVTQFLDDAAWVADAAAGDPASHSIPAQVVTASLEKQLTGIYWGNQPLTLTAGDTRSLQQLADSWIAATSTVTDRTQTIDVGGGQNVNLSDPGMTARVITTSRSTWPDADVAILKVDATNLPAIPLGDDTIAQTGDAVYALGYPYDASFASGTSPNTTVTATFTSGQVTNRLQSPDGFSAIEDSAPINHGSSGGPLLNSSGQAIGIATAIDSSADTATAVNGGKFYYAIPVSVVRKYLQIAGVPVLMPRDEPTWNQAMSLMQQSHYSAALTDLREAETDGYSTPYTMMHTQMIEAAIRNGADKSLPQTGPFLLLLALTVAAGLICIGSAVTLLVIRRLQPPRSQGAMTMPFPVQWPSPFQQNPAPPAADNHGNGPVPSTLA